MTTTNDLIIEETNILLENLKDDMIAINDISLIINESIITDTENLNIIETNIESANNDLNDSINILKKINVTNIIGGVVVCSSICSGIGLCVGIVPAIIGFGIGSSTGFIIGYYSESLFNKGTELLDK
jgi:hypothetical protein